MSSIVGTCSKCGELVIKSALGFLRCTGCGVIKEIQQETFPVIEMEEKKDPQLLLD